MKKLTAKVIGTMKKPTVKDSVTNTNVSRYLQTTYFGKELLKKHKLDEYGVWQVLGEDPNCDMGGHHSQPELAIIDGTLLQAITVGVDLPGFWQWGAGGDFRKATIQKAEEANITEMPNVPTLDDLRKRVAKMKAKQDEEVKKVAAKVLAEFSEFLSSDANLAIGTYRVAFNAERSVEFIALVGEKLETILHSGGYDVDYRIGGEVEIRWKL
jgi:hypothetical protein